MTKLDIKEIKNRTNFLVLLSKEEGQRAFSLYLIRSVELLDFLAKVLSKEMRS